jgi:hypothetical protein
MCFIDYASEADFVFRKLSNNKIKLSVASDTVNAVFVVVVDGK